MRIETQEPIFRYTGRALIAIGVAIQAGTIKLPVGIRLFALSVAALRDHAGDCLRIF